MIKEKIDAAIVAHSMWKGRIRDAIATGHSDFDPAKVGMDNQCDFGKWLYSLDSTMTSDPHFQKVKTDHALFHSEAGRILKLALEGKKAEAETGINLGSPFASASSQCIMTLSDWKKILKD